MQHCRPYHDWKRLVDIVGYLEDLVREKGVVEHDEAALRRGRTVRMPQGTAVLLFWSGNEFKGAKQTYGQAERISLIARLKKVLIAFERSLCVMGEHEESFGMPQASAR